MSFSTHSSPATGLGYLIHHPVTYASRESWPLILFLHGIGERGTNPEAVASIGLPALVEDQPDFPFIVAAPQCPPDALWLDRVGDLPALLDEICAGHAVDPSRVYLTGMSMGGTGAWALAAAHPGRFAALAVVCGQIAWANGDPLKAVAPLAEMPTWVFHGAQDDIVPPTHSERLVEALIRLGSRPRFTLYPYVEHASWNPAYATDELYDWFLEHTL